MAASTKVLPSKPHEACCRAPCSLCLAHASCSLGGARDFSLRIGRMCDSHFRGRRYENDVVCAAFSTWKFSTRMLAPLKHCKRVRTHTANERHAELSRSSGPHERQHRGTEGDAGRWLIALDARSVTCFASATKRGGLWLSSEFLSSVASRAVRVASFMCSNACKNVMTSADERLTGGGGDGSSYKG